MCYFYIVLELAHSGIKYIVLYIHRCNLGEGLLSARCQNFLIFVDIVVTPTKHLPVDGVFLYTPHLSIILDTYATLVNPTGFIGTLYSY